MVFVLLLHHMLILTQPCFFFLVLCRYFVTLVGFVSRSVGCFVLVFRGALFSPWFARPARFRAIRTIFG